MLSARERSVHLTYWLGRSWEKIHHQPDHHRCFWRYFEYTGCLITADGSNDDKSTPKDWIISFCLDHLYIRTFLQMRIPGTFPPQQPRRRISSPPTVKLRRRIFCILAEDSRKHRLEASDFTHKDVNRQVKALYNNRWHTRTVQCYNREFFELKVDFLDGSIDYFSPDVFDGIDVFLFKFLIQF